ncbi:MAG: hypothetical protein CM15mP117_03460 [Alphaproteobacteria bacterium]|nr:MAG: hypothetical protein CM15mP117_03460 [Alphaproteobacteria bacterium]
MAIDADLNAGVCQMRRQNYGGRKLVVKQIFMVLWMAPKNLLKVSGSWHPILIINIVVDL